MKSINQLIPETIYLYRSIKNENTSVYPVRAATHQLRSKLKGLKSSGSSPCVILLYLISFVKQIKQTSAQCSAVQASDRECIAKGGYIVTPVRTLPANLLQLHALTTTHVQDKTS